jgi:hypothetical protein
MDIQLLNYLDKLLSRYEKALKTGNRKKIETIYNNFIDTKKEIRQYLSSFEKEDKKRYKLICSEFNLLSNEEDQKILFDNKETPK